MKKNVASQSIGAQLVSKTDGSAVTSGTTTIYVTGDAGTQAAGSVGSGACTHEGNGYWTYAPAQAETNYDLIAFTFVNSTACNATVQVYTTFPQTGDSYARIGAPAGASVSADIVAVKSDTAGIKTKTDSLTFTVAGHVDSNVLKVGGTTQTARDIGASVLLSAGTGTGQLDFTSGVVKANTTQLAGQTVTAAAGVTFPTSVASPTNITAGTITTATNLTTNNDKTGYTIASGGIPSGAHASAELNNIADATLDRNMATGTDSGTNSTSVRTPRQALRALRNKASIAAGVATVTKEDDSTTSWTAAVATTAGNPVSSIDPT